MVKIDAEALLADPASYECIEDWEDRSRRLTSALAYYEMCDTGDWTQHDFVEAFLDAPVSVQLEVHEILDQTFPDDPRITYNDIALLQRHFQPAGISDELFARAVLGISEDHAAQLIGKAVLKEIEEHVEGREQSVEEVRESFSRLAEQYESEEDEFVEDIFSRKEDAKRTLASQAPKLEKTSKMEDKNNRASKKHRHSDDSASQPAADEENGSLVGTASQLPTPANTPQRQTNLDHCVPGTERTLRKRKRSETVSRFFPSAKTTKSSKKKPALRGPISQIPIPPLNARSFGLAQERLSSEPFQLLIAVQFLNKTRGITSMPVFWDLMERYPTPAALANADVAEIVPLIQHLGLQNQRARKVVALARCWMEQPPRKGVRHRSLHYPRQGAGRDIKPKETIGDDDEREGAWEVAHLPGVGAYAIDSWRIFCRDQLRGLADGYNGEDSSVDRCGVAAEAAGQEAQRGFEPEWKRVVPQDKELRACLRWMWLREGWEWDPLTGQKRRASEELMETARRGALVWEDWNRGKTEDTDVETAIPPEDIDFASSNNVQADDTGDEEDLRE